eukprot:4504140-Pyramimonas_sp.AAC.1
MKNAIRRPIDVQGIAQSAAIGRGVGASPVDRFGGERSPRCGKIPIASWALDLSLEIQGGMIR